MGNKLLLCTGRHCRRALDEEGRVVQALAGLPVRVQRVPCQKVCRGPVVGVRVAGEWQWFERMNSAKALRALSQLLEEGCVPQPLRKRQNRRRSGRRRD